MDSLLTLLAFVLGGAAGWLIGRRPSSNAPTDISGLVPAIDLAHAQGQVQTLNAQIEGLNAQITDLQRNQLAAERVDALFKPLQEQVQTMSQQSTRAAADRAQADEELRQRIDQLKEGTDKLSSTTQAISAVMTNSQVRGQWGEMQLERILEFAGLVEGVHYVLQSTTTDGSGRPDCVLLLPNGGRIVIDSKFPLADYMAAQQETEPARAEELLKAHAKTLLEHCKALAKRDYTKDADTVEFVLAFLPVEVLLSSALSTNPALLEDIYRLNVGVATPVTLMPLLKTLHHTWQKHEFAKNALKIQDEGSKMLDRLVRLGALITKVGSGLKTTVNSFNDMVGSFDQRVVPAARDMRALGLTAASDMTEVGPVDTQVREVRSPQVLEFPTQVDPEEGTASHTQS